MPVRPVTLATVTLTTPDGRPLVGPTPAVTLSDGRLGLRTAVEVPAEALAEVVVDGVPGAGQVVRSGRWHAEACDRLDRAAGWRSRVPWPGRARDLPVVLVRLDPEAPAAGRAG